MIYGLNTNYTEDGYWFILDGWEGCLAGQGTLLKSNLTEVEMRILLEELE